MPEGPGISVTLKHRESERYASDGTWVVSHGEPRVVQKYLAETFGLELAPDEVLAETILRAERAFRSLDSSKPQPIAAKNPTSITVNAPQAGKPDDIAKQMRAALAAEGLAAPTPEQAVENVVKGLDGEVIEDDPWESAKGQPEQDQGLGKDELLDAIEKAESKTALRSLHAANVELFKQDKYKDALRARAKEVS